MEFDDLKAKWRELDGRLADTDRKTDLLAAEVAAGKITPAKERVARETKRGIFLLIILPALCAGIFRHGETKPGVAVIVFFALFIGVMLVRQVVLLRMLAQIDPGVQSVRETCAAVLRFRTAFLAGVGVGVVLAVPLLVLLGVFMGSQGSPYMLYGFLAGLIVGIPIGVRIFLRMIGDINRMRTALRDVAD